MRSANANASVPIAKACSGYPSAANGVVHRCSRHTRRGRARHSHRAGVPPRNVFATNRRLAGIQASRPGAVTRLQAQSLICLSRGQLQQPVRQPPAVADHAGTLRPLPKAVNRHEQLARVAARFGELLGAGIGWGHGGTIPFGREQREAAGQVQFDLFSIPRRPFRQRRQRRETAVEMADRFEMRQTRGGILAGLQPLIDRTLGIAGGGQMMRQEFRLALDEIGEMLFQHGRDPGVQFLPPCAQQGAIGGVLHKRMLEEVGGLRGNTAAEQESSLGKPIEPQSQLGSRPLRHPLDQLVTEFAAEHCADLPDILADRSETIEARDQRGVQGGGDRELRQRARRQHRRDLVGTLAAFENRLGQFFDEQGHAVCALDDLVDRFA